MQHDHQDTLPHIESRFEAAVLELRPALYRFCKRMTGSSLDGEDLVQETLTRAFERLDSLDPERPIKPWLFRIAHNLCVDLLRKWHGAPVPFDEQRDAVADRVTSTDDADGIHRALEKLVTGLPPKERACVMLKDVLNHSLSDIAVIVDSTVGGVKAALHRGRKRLREMPASVSANKPLPDATRQLLQQYIDHFNRQDWDGVCELLRADARLEIVGVGMNVGHAPFRKSYFHNHSVLPSPWQLGLGRIDHVPVVLEWRYLDDRWQLRSASRIEVKGDHIASVRDYMHVAHVLDDADIEGDPPSTAIAQ